MAAEISVLNEWIPEQMEPGTVFFLENAGEAGDSEDPYLAVMSCPRCGTLGLITRCQVAGLTSVICGSGNCSAEYYLRDEEIAFREPS